MIINAKFASTCSCCRQPIAVGTKIEWAKGSPAKHVACAVDTAAAPVRAAPSVPRPTRARPWRPCGYPGCNPGYCDECNGEGLVLSSSSGRSYRPR